MKSKLLMAFVALALFGCGGPKDRVVPADMGKWEAELEASIENLDEEDKKLFASFVARARLGEVFGNKGVEKGLTIGKAIEHQKAWIERKKREEAEAERAALLKQADDLLAVTVLKLEVVSESSSERQLLELGLRNKGKKDIHGVKGTVKFMGISGKEVGAIEFSYDNGLKAGASAVWKGSRHYNPLVASHKAVANLEEGKYTTRFEPEMIVFTDGTEFAIKKLTGLRLLEERLRKSSSP